MFSTEGCRLIPRDACFFACSNLSTSCLVLLVLSACQLFHIWVIFAPQFIELFLGCVIWSAYLVQISFATTGIMWTFTLATCLNITRRETWLFSPNVLNFLRYQSSFFSQDISTYILSKTAATYGTTKPNSLMATKFYNFLLFSVFIHVCFAYLLYYWW